MARSNILTCLITLVAAMLIGCGQRAINDTVLTLPGDPFAKTIVSLQSFSIDSKQDNVVEGENGTFIVCPKGCFKNSDGEVVESEVRIELAEVFSMEEMVLSNLTTTSNGNLLETDGMIYFNATFHGEQLTINRDNPVHIEIPTPEKKPGMKIYKGVRDGNGNMNWIEPIDPDKFLDTVNLDSLDFLPEGFGVAVDIGMPFRNHQSSTRNLIDSLYYALSVSNADELVEEFSPTDINEPYYKKNDDRTDEKSIKSESNCGIDPAIIKVIKSKKFQNTFIATREFEARLKVILSTCDNSILETYIRNLNLNLYEVDSMAAMLCEEKRHYNAYHTLFDFSKLRLTKIRQADKYAELLKGHYKRELAKVKSELTKQRDKVMRSLAQDNKAAQNLVNDYKKLLWKREKFRMETYGFNLTETGWVNVDNGVLPKDWGNGALEVVVENGKQFDRVYTYVIYSSIKSLYRLNTTDNENFYVGNDDSKEMLMPKQAPGIVISIGYTSDEPSMVTKIFETNSETKLTLTLLPSSMDKVKETLKTYQEYSKENRIMSDLNFMQKLYEEEQRQKKLLKESEFMKQLRKIAYPCCAKVEETGTIEWDEDE